MAFYSKIKRVKIKLGSKSESNLYLYNDRKKLKHLNRYWIFYKEKSQNMTTFLNPLQKNLLTPSHIPTTFLDSLSIEVCESLVIGFSDSVLSSIEQLSQISPFCPRRFLTTHLCACVLNTPKHLYLHLPVLLTPYEVQYKLILNMNSFRFHYS